MAAIVLLEQNSYVRELISDYLGELKLNISCVTDGYEALDLARAQHPAVVITEVITPRLDGLSLCRLLKADDKTSGTKVLVLSVLEVKEKAMQAGADAFLAKPIEKLTFLAAVRFLLQSLEQGAK